MLGAFIANIIMFALLEAGSLEFCKMAFKFLAVDDEKNYKTFDGVAHGLFILGFVFLLAAAVAALANPLIYIIKGVI